MLTDKICSLESIVEKQKIEIELLKNKNIKITDDNKEQIDKMYSTIAKKTLRGDKEEKDVIIKSKLFKN